MYMVLCWLTSPGTSELFSHIHVCVSLFPLAAPAMSSQLTQHSPAPLPVSQRLSLVARCHQLNRCSLQQVLSSPLQPPAPKQLCSIPVIKLMGSVGFCVLLSPLLTSSCFLQETVKRARQPLFYWLFIGTSSDNFTTFSLKLFF